MVCEFGTLDDNAEVAVVVVLAGEHGLVAVGHLPQHLLEACLEFVVLLPVVERAETVVHVGDQLDDLAVSFSHV